MVTLGQANWIAERFARPRVGVVVDAFHVWWDPDLEREIARAGRASLATTLRLAGADD